MHNSIKDIIKKLFPENYNFLSFLKQRWIVERKTKEARSLNEKDYPDYLRRYVRKKLGYNLDLENPRKVLGIYRQPLIAPEADYEVKNGFRTNVIFPTGAILEDDGTVKIYYGASDTVIALVTAKADDLVDLCLRGCKG